MFLSFYSWKQHYNNFNVLHLTYACCILSVPLQVFAYDHLPIRATVSVDVPVVRGWAFASEKHDASPTVPARPQSGSIPLSKMSPPPQHWQSLSLHLGQ